MRAIVAFLRQIRRWFSDSVEAPPCPQCGDDRLVAWDAVLQRFVCDVCSHQWRQRRAAGGGGHFQRSGRHEYPHA